MVKKWEGPEMLRWGNGRGVTLWGGGGCFPLDPRKTWLREEDTPKPSAPALQGPLGLGLCSSSLGVRVPTEQLGRGRKSEMGGAAPFHPLRSS